MHQRRLHENGSIVYRFRPHLQANWVIDLGLDASDEGGQLVAEGPPPTLSKNKQNTPPKPCAKSELPASFPAFI